MGNNTRPFRLPRLYQPGESLGYRDIDMLLDQLVKKIRALESDKLNVSDAPTVLGSQNVALTLLGSAARTTDGTSPDQSNPSYSRLLLVVDVSAAAGGSVTPRLQVKDSISGNYLTVWQASAALTAVGTYAYYFADGGAGGQNWEPAGFGLPSSTWRVLMHANNANSITYSVSGEEMI